MDLDNLKKDWREANITASVGQDKIKHMLDNRGQSAFEKLLKYERLFLYLLIPCFVIGVLSYFIAPHFGLVYGLLLIGTFFWQIYKIKFLKGTDYLRMDILEIAQQTNKYKTLLYKEILLGIILVPVLSGLYSYDLYYNKSVVAFWSSFIFMLVFIFIFSFVLYKCLYYKNIKQIEHSIKEIKEFEKDNI